MQITRDIIYVGVNDRETVLFEGQYPVPNGMSYNSYLIKDKKTAVMDTVDLRFADEWLANIRAALDGGRPDYLVVQHMEPDHSGSILRFIDAYPDAVLVASAKAFTMMENFYGVGAADRRMVVGEGDTLALGSHTLAFITAPMVHWPEVIMSCELSEKVLFSADAFGKFGALDVDEPWLDEARRYYFGIVGKFGAQVQNLLRKAAGLDFSVICPLHGPVLRDGLEGCIALYDAWSSYAPESEGVLIAYTSVYGNTKKAVEMLKERLDLRGCPETAVRDLCTCRLSDAVADAFRFGSVVFASTTYNAGVFPPMREFISALTERGFSKRRVAFIENGSWAPTAAKTMKAMLENCKELTFAGNTVTLLSAPSESTPAALDALADELCGR
ncbi:MAG: FprA family A-type flavoprotein [Oscillospiraceae bacterium]|nr:FprA family A-type flavoprotein [Oscillospiraceae bacterium]